MKAGLIICCLAAALCVFQPPATAVEDPSYELSAWPYGAIAWVGGVLETSQSQSQILAQALEDVFSLWGLPPLPSMLGWEDPSQVESSWQMGIRGSLPQVLKKNPATGQLWRLSALTWEGIDAYPLLILAFPDRILLSQAVGTTAIGGLWIYGSAAIAGSEPWFQALTGVPNSMTVPAVDGMLATWHEFAHWLTYLVCQREGTSIALLPDLLIEGIAEYTETFFAGLSGRKAYAAEWAEDHALTLDLDHYDIYRIGASLVAYLVETQGTAGFLASLDDWAADPQAQISSCEPGWRAWLGLD